MQEQLENLINEGITRYASANGYQPTRFMELRRELGTVAAIEQLMTTATIQIGFVKMMRNGLSNYTCEAAILRFPELFTQEAADVAKFRLENWEQLT